MNVTLAPSRMNLAFTGTGGWPQLVSENKKQIILIWKVL